MKAKRSNHTSVPEQIMTFQSTLANDNGIITYPMLQAWVVRICGNVNESGICLIKKDYFIKMINSLSKTDDFIKIINSLNKTDDFTKTHKFS